MTSGESNTMLGVDAGNNIGTTSSNICIGRAAQIISGGGNEIIIGSATYWVGTNGAANTYWPSAAAGAAVLPVGATGWWRLAINGTIRKIAVYGD